MPGAPTEPTAPSLGSSEPSGQSVRVALGPQEPDAGPLPSDAGLSDQLALIGPRGGLLPRPSAARHARAQAGQDPVARVLLDSPVPRLDRPFDYLVPEDLDGQVRLGVRVRVRFGRQRTEGWVLGRGPRADHSTALQWLDAVVGAEPHFTDETLALARSVADHYVGTLSDVLRLAIPKRHAAAAAAAQARGPALPLRPAGPASDTALNPGQGRWVWTCPPGQDWAAWFAATLARTASEGGCGLAVVPDRRDVQRLVGLLRRILPDDVLAVLTAHGSAADRYAAFRAAFDGSARVVVGTRSAAFAPLAEPDLLLLWDDGDDSHQERRAPYPHAREVLAMRSTADNAFVVGSYGRSTNAQRWLDIGWARQLGPSGADLRRSAPRVTATMDDRSRSSPGERSARLPPQAGAAIRAGLAQGPVLIGVGRVGYVPRVRCRTCGTPAQCPYCGGPLGFPAQGSAAACGRCGRTAIDWRCEECGGALMRSSAVGSERTGEELGRAFPNVPVRVSSGERILDRAGPESALVIATPGAEPPAEGGYAAVVLLDIASALAQPGLRSQEQAARRWFSAGALARPNAPLVMVADPAWPTVQALMRWSPGWLAQRELTQRRETRMPPAAKAVSVLGERAELQALQSALPTDVEVLGPVQDGERERILLTCPHRAAPAVIAALRAFVVRRSAEGARPITVQVDPPDLL